MSFFVSPLLLPVLCRRFRSVVACVEGDGGGCRSLVGVLDHLFCSVARSTRPLPPFSAEERQHEMSFFIFFSLQARWLALLSIGCVCSLLPSLVQPNDAASSRNHLPSHLSFPSAIVFVQNSIQVALVWQSLPVRESEREGRKRMVATKNQELLLVFFFLAWLASK